MITDAIIHLRDCNICLDFHKATYMSIVTGLADCSGEYLKESQFTNSEILDMNRIQSNNLKISFLDFIDLVEILDIELKKNKEVDTYERN